MKYQKIHNINIIHLSGTEEDMAAQHGKFLKEQLKNSALIKLASKNQFMITQSGGILSNIIFQKIVIYFYNNLLIPILSQSLPNSEKRKLRALSINGHIDYKILLRAFYQADALMVLARFSMMKYLFFKFPKMDLPGCSSSVVSAENTRENNMLVMRNQDYPIVGSWEKNTTVAYCTPNDSKTYKHIFVTSAGLHTSGLTAMNEKGLTVAVHAHFGKRIRLNGQPIFTIAENIIKKASSICEAEEIIKNSSTYANWTIVVSSANENNAVAFEITPTEYAKRKMKNGILSHTNFFQTRDLNKTEALINGSRHDDDFARKYMLNNFCQERSGKVTIEDLIELCGSHYDPFSKSNKIFGNTVSVMTTVKSVVMDPKNFTIYVSTRDKTPVGIGDFLRINLKTFFKEETPILIKNPNKYETEFINQLEIYRQSYIEGQMNGNYNLAFEIIKQISGQHSSDPHVNMQATYLAFKLKKYEDALYYLDSVNTNYITSHIQACVHVFKYQTYQKLGRYTEAKKTLEMMDYPICEKLENAKKTKSQKLFKNIMIDMQFPEPIEY